MLDKYSSPNIIMSDSHCGHQLNVFISVSQKKVLQIELACQLESNPPIKKSKKKFPTSGQKKLARNVDTI